MAGGDSNRPAHGRTSSAAVRASAHTKTPEASSSFWSRP